MAARAHQGHAARSERTTVHFLPCTPQHKLVPKTAHPGKRATRRLTRVVRFRQPFASAWPPVSTLLGERRSAA